MKRAQLVLDWIGHWLDGEVSPRVEVATDDHKPDPRHKRKFT